MSTTQTKRISVEDFEGRMDSLYRLIIVASRRAIQLGKPETRPLVDVESKKTTMIALHEILEGKVTAQTDAEADEDILE